MDKSLYILLASCNGERYIGEQIQSIQEQSIKDWTLCIRDDGSTDKTVDIVKSFMESDKRIHLITDKHGNQGAASNFSLLSEHAYKDGATYVMYADQDDCWESGKISSSLTAMHEAEKNFGVNTPLLVHSDMMVVDENLQEIHPSFMQYQSIHHEEVKAINTLLVQNFVTGCTMLANRPLLSLALPFPRDIVMHDWWFALCAASLGHIGFVAEKTLKYRQHSNNEIGAKGALNTFFIKKMRTKRDAATSEFVKTLRQAQALRSLLKEIDGIDPSIWNTVDGYCGLFERNMNAAIRLYKFRQLGIGRQGVMTNLLLKLRMIRLPCCFAPQGK